MKIFAFCILLLLEFVAAASPRRETIAPDVPGNRSLDRPSSLSHSVSALHSKIFEKISQVEHGNIFYSPLGLHMPLFQVYLGAPKNSSASKELANLLSLSTENDSGYLTSYQQVLATQEAQLSRLHQGSIVRIAHKLYLSDHVEVKSEFKNLVTQYFKSSIQQVNFSDSKETVKTINNFLIQATNGLIREIFKEKDIGVDTEMILLNAIYFKGSWKYPFDKSLTEPMTFYVDQSTQAQFSAMLVTQKLKLISIQELESTVLELPYRNEQISMIIILPNGQVNIRQVEKKLQSYKSTQLAKKLNGTAPSKVQVIMPKFETTFDVPKLIESLRSLGVNSIFGNAGLSIMTDHPLVVSKIVQKAVIKVNEEGSEAAAVTGLEETSRIASVIKEFNVNKPFIFYIYDHANHLPLFVGRIVDPNGIAKLQPGSSIQSVIA
jgi:serine protease inhibitor